MSTLAWIILPKNDMLPNSKHFGGLADSESGHFYLKFSNPDWAIFYSNVDDAWSDAKHEMKHNPKQQLSICQVNIDTTTVCDALTAVMAGNTFRKLELLCVEFLDVN